MHGSILPGVSHCLLLGCLLFILYVESWLSVGLVKYELRKTNEIHHKSSNPAYMDSRSLTTVRRLPMKHIASIQRALAIVIMACFFLPLCQCTAKMPPRPESATSGVVTTEVLVPFRKIHFQDADEMLLVVLFAWPLVFLVAHRAAQSKRKAVLIAGAEFLFGIASIIYLGLILKLWGELRYGGVIAMLAFIASTVISGSVALNHVLPKRV